jgi:Na+-driven multidrug efflux pump
MERRPTTFAVLNCLRPAFVLGCSTWLVATGHGVEGAVAGTGIGTAAGVVAAVVVGRNSYTVAFDPRHIRRIVARGSRFTVLIVALWVVHSADVLIISRFASEEEVGFYRLAGRVAAFVSYFVSAFLMAWAPLERTALFKGTYDRFGRTAVRSTLFTYYVVVALSIVLAMAVTADVLIKIAAPSYAPAAEYIAPIGLGFVAYGAFVVLGRNLHSKHRMLVYGGVAVACAALFVGLSVVLVPEIGVVGAALAVAAAMSAGCVVLFVVVARGTQPIPFQWDRLAGVLALAFGAYAIVRWAAPDAGAAQPWVEGLVFAGYLGMLVLLRIVPWEHLRPLGRIARSLGPGPSRRRLLARVNELPGDLRAAMLAVVRDGLELDRAASALAADERDVAERFVQALRVLDGHGGAHPADAAIGAYLLSREPPAEREVMAHELLGVGVDALELHDLESTYARLRSARPRAWRRRREPLPVAG